MLDAGDKHAIRCPEDLKRVYFRAQDEAGRWDSVNAYEATNLQFHTWAASRMDIADLGNTEWPLEERVQFCHLLYSRGALVVLPPEDV